MSGKKGGVVSGIRSATGLGNGTVRYIIDPLSALAGDQRNARRKVQNEIAAQDKIQADMEAAALDKQAVAGESEKQRKKRSAQKSIAGSRAGRSGTILTSPLGDSSAGGDAGPGGKTLLGA